MAGDEDTHPGLRAALQNLKGKKNLIGVEVGVCVGFHAEDILEKLDMESLFLVDPYQPWGCNS